MSKEIVTEREVKEYSKKKGITVEDTWTAIYKDKGSGVVLRVRNKYRSRKQTEQRLDAQSIPK